MTGVGTSCGRRERRREISGKWDEKDLRSKGEG